MNYETPGVYVEEVSSGPRPVQASPTGDTGFVAVLPIPKEFHLGEGQGYKSLIPATRSSEVSASWARELAFRALLPAPKGDPKLLVAGQETSDAALGRALGAVDKKKKEYFELDGTEYDSASAVIAELKKNAGSYTISKKVPGAAGKPATKSGADIKVDVDIPGEGPTPISDLIHQAMGDKWSVSGERSGDTVRLRVATATESIDVGVPQSMLVWAGQDKGWVLASPALRTRCLATIAAAAINQDIGADANVDDPTKPIGENVLGAVQEAVLAEVPVLHSLDAFLAWRDELGDLLYIELASALSKMRKATVRSAWNSPEARPMRAAWLHWIRNNPGMQRLELSIRGFFENGGSAAYPAVVLSAGGSTALSKKEVLTSAFDNFNRVAMLAAPGLSRDWQQSILEYCGPRNKGGRGDLFAVLEAPRYLFTNPRDMEMRDRLSKRRWLENYEEGDDPNFELQTLQTRSDTDPSELRNRRMDDTLLSECVPRDDVGHGAAYGPWLVVENPNSSGPADRYIIAPPSGHIAGMIAATDAKPGGGVHKAPANEQLMGVQGLVTDISDRDQAPLNTRGINVVRKRLNAGIRVWGARTVASDPLWRYINVRRLFLFVERSVSEAVQWAVFLPNNDVTRGDLKSTISTFLYRLYMSGALDGESPAEAYKVRCDRENNPDVDVRSGLLTVDVELRPVFPAEFIRLRFRQSPVNLDVTAGG